MINWHRAGGEADEQSTVYYVTVTNPPCKAAWHHLTLVSASDFEINRGVMSRTSAINILQQHIL